jgi:Acetyltransferase (GNAT) domain
VTTFRVLTADGDSRREWLEAWEATGREPFAHPTYVQLFEVEGAHAHCAVSTSGGDVVLLPFLVRPVRVDGWAPQGDFFDAISPYGYGGPYGTPRSEQSALWVDLHHWLSERGVVSFFGRLAIGESPAQLPGNSAVISDSENVIVNLRRSTEEQWRVYDHKVRKNVNKALRSGLTSEIRGTFSDVSEFTSHYHSTMDRRNASQRYYFDESFFRTIADEMADNHIVAEVRDPLGTLVSAELVLASDNYLYSFLGGTSSEAFLLRPNDLLKHTVIEYGRESGLRGYVLGGGLGRDDGIFRYKRPFDPAGCVLFRRLAMICDDAAYSQLVEHRLAASCEAAVDDTPDPAFFPAYRAPLVSAPNPIDEA